MAKILVVDDHLPSRTFLSTLLNYKGHTVIQASDGAEALARVKTERPDLVISDILMPTTDGYKFVRQLRADPAVATTRVVFWTATYHVREARALAEACGVLYTIRKPAEPQTLLEIVEAALGRVPRPLEVPLNVEFDREHFRLISDKLEKKIVELAKVEDLNAALLEFMQRLAKEGTVESLLGALCEAARRLTAARHAAIGLFSADESTLRPFLTAGLDQEAKNNLSAPNASEGLVAKLRLGLRPFRTGDIGSDPVMVGFPPSHHAARSFLGIPLLVGRHACGVIYLMEKLGADGFSEADEKMVSTLVTQAMVNYENQRLVQQLRLASSNLGNLAAIVENSDDAIVGLALDGTISSWNPGATRICGHSDSETIGRPIDILEFPGTQQMTALVEQVRLGKTIRHFECARVNKQGKQVCISLTASPVKDSAGQIVGASLIARDVTETKLAENSLRETIKAKLESEERIRLQAAALNAAANAIVITDARGLIQWTNPAFTTLTGYPPEDVIGQNPRILKSGKQDRAFYRNLWKSILSGEVWTGELENRKKNGEVYNEEMSIAPVRSLTGEITNFISVKQNVTERKRTSLELLNAKEAAEVANRAKSEFLANMSHEIRTPMNGILGMTDLALETETTPEQADYLHMVKDSAEALLTILNDILDFSKIEAGKLELDHLSFDLRKSLAGVVKTLAVKAQQKGLEFIFDVQPDVPASVMGDPTRLRQILVNLVGNATKFTESGEIEVNVRADMRDTSGALLHFTVRDTGIGVSHDKQELIFSAFSQADTSTTRKYGGTGLGLTISSQLVTLMGGKIWLESIPERGSTFHFTAQVGVDTPVPCESLDASQLAGVRMLVVDDNATNRRIFEDSSIRWKMFPTVVGSAAAAIRELKNAMASGAPFPLVLTDAHMPDVDGFELVQRIRSDPTVAGTKIVLLTSNGVRGDAARCQKLGIAAYLSKPFDRLELRDVLIRVLAGAPTIPEPGDLVTRHSVRDQQQTLSFLVAEDNPVNQRLITRFLEKRGHTVVLAQNGREAIQSLEKRAFDILLMDVQMPEMDGYEATELIRMREKQGATHLPIIALTAHAMKGDEERCLAAGMDGYVSKPIKLEELFSVIENVVPGITRRSEVGDAPPPREPHTSAHK